MDRGLARDNKRILHPPLAPERPAHGRYRRDRRKKRARFPPAPDPGESRAHDRERSAEGPSILNSSTLVWCYRSGSGGSMIIGVPKEVKDHETRVGLVPSGVTALREAGHEVLVQSTAGEGSSITDREYMQAGGAIV